MKKLKSLLISMYIVSIVTSSCSLSTPSEIDITIEPSIILPTSTFTFTSEPTHPPTIIPKNTPTPTFSKTRIDLSPELYLDENSSRDNLQGELYYRDHYNFNNSVGHGFIYTFQNEEWVAALTSTRVLPFDDDPYPNEGELRQYYIQLWKDNELLYFLPVYGYGFYPEELLRYGNHWIFWFMNMHTNQGQIVQDGVFLNELHDYDSAFSISLLDGKPFFFFQRDKQFGISFNNQEILLPYSNIEYNTPCCDNGGMFNPRATDIMVSFYTQISENEYQYIEIGLK